jgi:hypothetical protein
MNEQDIRHLRIAIEVAENARLHGNHPFGAILVDGEGREVMRAELRHASPRVNWWTLPCIPAPNPALCAPEPSIGAASGGWCTR